MDGELLHSESEMKTNFNEGSGVQEAKLADTFLNITGLRG